MLPPKKPDWPRVTWSWANEPDNEPLPKVIFTVFLGSNIEKVVEVDGSKGWKSS